MPPPLVPDALRAEPFLGVEAVRAGLLSRRQLESRTWRRLFRGCYVHRDVAVTHVLRVEAACLLLPDGVVTGRSPPSSGASTSPDRRTTWRSPATRGPIHVASPGPRSGGPSYRMVTDGDGGACR